MSDILIKNKERRDDGMSESAMMSWRCIGVVVIVLLFMVLVDMLAVADDTIPTTSNTPPDIPDLF